MASLHSDDEIGEAVDYLLEQFREARGDFDVLHVQPSSDQTSSAIHSDSEVRPEPQSDDFEQPLTNTTTTNAAYAVIDTDTSKRTTRSSTTTHLIPPSDKSSSVKTAASVHKKTQSQLKPKVNSDRPKFGEYNSKHLQNGVPRYPGQQYQNALDVPEESFIKIQAKLPGELTKAYIDADLKLMGILAGKGGKAQTTPVKTTETFAKGEDHFTTPAQPQQIADTATEDASPVNTPKDAMTSNPPSRSTRSQHTALHDQQDPVSISAGSKRPAEDYATEKTPKRLKIHRLSEESLNPPVDVRERATKHAADEPLQTPSAKRIKISVYKETSSGSDASDSSNKSGLTMKLRDAKPSVASYEQATSEHSSSDEATDSRSKKARSKRPSTQPAATAKSKRNKNSKSQSKPMEYMVPPGYVGAPSYHGYATNPPANATLTTPWQCGDLKCNTGLTWHHWNKPVNGGTSGNAGRKMISNYFGRNKSSTSTIPAQVWHMKCRKHYQRSDYQNKQERKKEDTARQEQINAGAQVEPLEGPDKFANLDTLKTLDTQIQRLEYWRPQAQWTIQLDSAGQKELDRFNEILIDTSMDQNLALTKFKASSKTSKLSNHFPPLLLQYFKNNFAGTNKTYTNLRAVTTWLKGHVDADSTDWLCPMEFIIQKMVDGETENDPNRNYQMWECPVMGRVYGPQTMYDLPVVPLPGQDPVAVQNGNAHSHDEAQNAEGDEETDED